MAKKAKKVANTIEDPKEKVPCGGYVRFLHEAGCEFPTNIVVEKYTPGSICKKCPGWWNFCPGFKELEEFVKEFLSPIYREKEKEKEKTE